MDKFDGNSVNIVNNNIKKIKELFPNVVTEGKIDFDRLKEMLGEEIDTPSEKYEFTWNGKADSLKQAFAPSSATLRPCKEKSKNWDTTENLYIEGDNLEVLKQLQKTYYGRVKMIYIDPPYNTGNDFVYKDDYKNSIANYIAQTEQSLHSNPETAGRYHSGWCSMMYPRLLLARNLLSDDGVIFISIDDHEQENLKKICSEVFGENNFIAELIWERAYAPKNDAKFISNSHDYVLMYAKSIERFTIGRLPRTDEANARYSNPDNDPRGVWKPSDLTVKTFSESGVYSITTPSGRIIEPPAGRCWRLSKKAFLERLQDNRIWFGNDGNSVPSMKRFLSELKMDGMAPTSIMFYKDVGHSQEGAQEVIKLLNAGVFDGPKPVRLLYRLLTLANLKDDSIVLDFFSGSASTGHAVMKYNAENNKHCKFIMVQLPESANSKKDTGFSTICDIGENRISRAGELIKSEWENNHLKGKDLFSKENNDFTIDIGFKVFKLDSTNINSWDNLSPYNEETLLNALEVFKKDRNNDDIAYEIMLKYGIFDKVIKQITINGKIMYSIENNFMIICLESLKNVNDVDISEIIKLKPQIVVFNEAGFADDNVKINAEYNLTRNNIETKCI